MDKFTVKDAETLYGVTGQTIRVWCGEFSEYLSPNANPGRRRTRMLTHDDMRVLALVASMQKDGFHFPDIHNSLHNGERGLAPESPDGLAELSQADQKLIQQMRNMQFRLDQTLMENESLKLESAELKAEVRLLREQLETMRTQLQGRADLERQLGRLEMQLEMLQGKFKEES